MFVQQSKEDCYHKSFVDSSLPQGVYLPVFSVGYLSQESSHSTLSGQEYKRRNLPSHWTNQEEEEHAGKIHTHTHTYMHTHTHIHAHTHLIG